MEVLATKQSDPTKENMGDYFVWTDGSQIGLTATSSDAQLFLTPLPDIKFPDKLMERLQPFISLDEIGGVRHTELNGFLIPFSDLPRINLWLQYFKTLKTVGSTDAVRNKATTFNISSQESLLLMALLRPEIRDRFVDQELKLVPNNEALVADSIFGEYMALLLRYVSARQQHTKVPLQLGDIVCQEIFGSLKEYPLLFDGGALVRAWDPELKRVGLPRQFTCPVPFNPTHYEDLNESEETQAWPLLTPDVKVSPIEGTPPLLDEDGDNLLDTDLVGYNVVVLQLSYPQGQVLYVYVGGKTRDTEVTSEVALQWIQNPAAKFSAANDTSVYTVIG